jgi:hypothetical protein
MNSQRSNRQSPFAAEFSFVDIRRSAAVKMLVAVCRSVFGREGHQSLKYRKFEISHHSGSQNSFPVLSNGISLKGNQKLPKYDNKSYRAKMNSDTPLMQLLHLWNESKQSFSMT